ncbi:MlaD family protein [Thalassobaculum sp. OXR-137]|uniref:MlaD family protein n=1 Tax=Thalassobaculum sp. OXR-137 TaxID=3100173 RepID=UPI002AC8F0AE|nr:MlaD family protein [Thalassobaculum sp. OXR-137]WPZ34672.1 MlaD family protein [Thalassobaculum sp. OXR-137]
METRASFVTVGAFAILLVVGGLFMAIWFGGVAIDQETRPYRIEFKGAVDGLSTGSAVRYRGVPVGTVSDIRIDPQNVELIRVDIEVDAEVPIKKDMYAVLQAQGLTGIGFIQIEGGTDAAEELVATEDQPVPRIPARSSALSKVFETAPQIADRLVVVIARIEEFLSDENEQNFRMLLANLAQVSAAVADRSDDIETAITGASESIANLRAAAAEVGPLLEEASATLATVRGTAVGLDSEVAALSGSLANAGDRIAATAGELEGMLADARPGMKDFTNTGLYELTQFLVEARFLVSNIDRVLRQIDRDPSQFLFGNRDGQVEADQ